MPLPATDPRRWDRPNPNQLARGEHGGRKGGGAAQALMAAACLTALAAPLIPTEPVQAAGAVPFEGAVELAGAVELTGAVQWAGPLQSTGPWVSAAPAKSAKGNTAPSTASQEALRKQAIQALERGDLGRGCPLLRRAIDQTGALYARQPSPALERELRGLLARLQPCMRKGL